MNNENLLLIHHLLDLEWASPASGVACVIQVAPCLAGSRSAWSETL